MVCVKMGNSFGYKTQVIYLDTAALLANQANQLSRIGFQ